MVRHSHRLRNGLSLAALLASTALVAPVRAAPVLFSPAYFEARGANLPGTRAAGAAMTSAATVQQSMANLQRAAAAIRAMQLAQTSARALTVPSTVANGPVADGLGPNGLQPAPGVSPGNTLWQGAALPTQTNTATRATVTVHQTTRQAVLTWSRFNVGRNTTLAFDQSAGGSAASTWVALNRVLDPQSQPSQILGSITAPGQVYVINANGVIFGSTSQVNTAALIASAADVNTAAFLQNGIYSSGIPNGSGGTTGYAPNFTGAAGAITVQAGAQITTNAPASANAGGGFVLLLGTGVQNAGAISTPSGQVAMAAGRNFVLTPGFGSSSNADPQATVQGNQVAVAAGKGTVDNTGLLQATDGDVTMVGHSVTQAGVIASSIGLGQRGTVHLLTDFSDPTASVTLAPGSVTAITIDAGSATAIAALRQQSPTLQDPNPLNTYAGLPDVRDLSRIEITSGGTVQFGAGSLSLASSGQIAVAAQRTVLMAPGASLDVSGLVGVTLPQSANVFDVSIEPYNLRDSPVNRDTGNLNSATVSVDGRTLLYVPPENGDTSARYYTGGGLLEVGGELGNVGYTEAEYATTGGTVDIRAAKVIAQPGSGINLAGGSITYQQGPVAQSWLISANDQLYNLNSATDNVVYTGVFTGFAETHPHWGISGAFSNPLIAPSSYEEPGYTVGQNAGSLTISAPTTLFAGAITAGTVIGPRQATAGVAGETGFLVTQTVVPQNGTLQLSRFGVIGSSVGLLPEATDVVIGSAAPVTAGLSLDSQIGASDLNRNMFSAAALDSADLGVVEVQADGTVAVTGPLAVADGGTIALLATQVAVSAPLVARGGVVTLGDAGPLYGLVSNSIGLTHPGITLTDGATIDVRGVWTNALLQPGTRSGEAWINGGSVALQSAASQTYAVPGTSGTSTQVTVVGDGITVSPGTAIDASAGGYVTASGTVTGGAGGNITIQSDVSPTGGAGSVNPGPSQHADLVLDGSLRDLGFTHGGTLTLEAPGIAIGDGLTPSYDGELILSPSLFRSGFSNYALTSATDIRIAPGAQVDVVEPVYQATTLTAEVPSGSAPDAAFDVVLPPLFLPQPARARLTQRVGASLTLDAPGEEPVPTPPGGTPPQGGAINAFRYGTFSLGSGASIAVDPGQSVIVAASNSVTVEGAITAPGGTIDVLDTGTPAGSGNQVARRTSIWIGPAATLDAGGIAFTEQDAFGRAYGTVTAGGLITLGNTPGSANGQQDATDAFIVIRPGAVVDASGASAVLDLDAGTAVTLFDAASSPVGDDTAGGTIRLASYTGIFPDGTLSAAPGGPSAAGGTLDVVLETGFYYTPPISGIPTPADETPFLRPRTILVTETAEPTLPQDTVPGGVAPPVGTATFSAQAIAAGGFGTVSLFGRDGVVFQGNVNVSVPQGLTLNTAAIADSRPGSQVVLAAPYVLLSGEGGLAPVGSGSALSAPFQGGQVSAPTGSSLSVDADLVDIQGSVQIGAAGKTVPDSTGYQRPVNLPGFDNVALSSSGDIRFLANPNSAAPTSFQTGRDLSLTAAQVYPETGATADIVVGISLLTGGAFDDPHATLTIARTAGSDPALPQSVFGNFTVFAPTIEQGGILRAPFGVINLGAYTGSVEPRSIDLLPGSITSTSADGLSVPYGGTSDGVTYTYQGGQVTFDYGTNSGGTNSTARNVAYGVEITGQAVTVDAGATLDLRGGGTLTGAGFVAGRGGSTDTLLSPLLSFGNQAVSAPTLGSTDAVYALLPGYGSAYAPPAQPDAGSDSGSLPAIGQTVTVGGGVPGLPAGTYTLLPSYYALQSGGYRIELRSGTTAPLGGPQALPNGSYVTGVRVGVANTGVLGAVPTDAILTPGVTVRRYTQYDEQSYSGFATTQASVSVFGQLRPEIPEDAGELDLAFGPTFQHMPSFTNNGTELLDPAPGGYGGTLAVYSASERDSLVIGTASTNAPGAIVVDAAALDTVNATNVVIGGEESGTDFNQAVPPTSIYLTGLTSSVTLAPGAVLTAPQVLLVSNAVSIDPRTTIETLGRTGSLLDSSSGLYFDTQNASAVAVSSGTLLFQPVLPVTAKGAGITIARNATLYAEDSLALVSPLPITLAPSARLGARSLDITATNINVGEPGSIPPGAAPPGALLSQELLSTLLTGNPAAGVPALQTLELTATQSLNFFGTTQLSAANPAGGQTSLGQFVLNTPGIYGYGGSGDIAVLNVGTLYWNGVAAVSQSQPENPTAVTVAQPPLVSPGGPGTGTGTLDITAGTIVFGAGPTDVPQAISSEPRAVVGFSTVDITASQQIVATGLGSLLVSQSQVPLQPNGTPTAHGGALNIATPLLTAGANGTLDITAGGAISLSPGAGATPSAARPNAAGGEIGLAAASIDDATAIVIPSGRVLLSATGDVTLESDARIDVSGNSTAIFDATAYGPGGTVALASSGGNVAVLPGASIAFGGAGNQAGGTLSVSAAQGSAVLAGATLQGGGPDPADSGAFTLDAGTLSDFGALNQALTAGLVFGARSFEVGSGNITIETADQVRAHEINVSVDRGSLVVDGLIDASGTGVGTIDLAGQTGLTLTANATLAAQGSVLATDSYGAPIDAINRADVSLTAAAGTLTLAPGATIDLNAADDVARGDLELNAPRVSADGGGVLISAPGSLSVTGAATIALNGFWTYQPADGVVVQSNLGAGGKPTDANGIGLDQINIDSTAFEAAASAALGNGSVAGLTAFGSIFHLRPGVQIEGVAGTLNPNGTLQVDGDLDLSGFRYGPGATGHGAGEPGVLVLRATGDLGVYGSISDGFGTPPPTPDQSGWTLASGTLTTATTVLTAVTLAPGTMFNNSDLSLGYTLPVAAGATIKAATAVPEAVTLDAPVTLTQGWTTTAPLTLKLRDGTLEVLPAGSTLLKGQRLPKGTELAVGSTLPDSFQIKAVAWGPSDDLAVFADPVSTARNLTLRPGQAVPAGTNVQLASGNASDPSRPVIGPRGAQGQIDALAPMLPAGSLSWSLDLVSGANLGAADPNAVRPLAPLADAGHGAALGDLVLDDPHNVGQNPTTFIQTPLGFSVIRTGTGSLSLAAGGSIEQQSPYGIYTAGTQASGVAASDEPAAVTTAGVSGGKAYRDAVRAQIAAGYQPYYPTDGGDLLVAAQGSIAAYYGGAGGFFNNGGAAAFSPAETIGWLWEQGTSSRLASYWINFGSYQQTGLTQPQSTQPPLLVGFTGFGTLGGGNLSLTAGGNVGAAADPLVPNADGLVVAVGSSGRVTGVQQTGTVVTGGTIAQTGGGDLTLQAGGAVLGPNFVQPAISPALVTDTRGSISVSAGSVGLVQPFYGSDTIDPRLITSVTNAETAYVNDGITLAIGDGIASVVTRGDLSLADAVDPGRQAENFFIAPGTNVIGFANVSYTGFSLWQPGSAIDLVSAGGNVSPNVDNSVGINNNSVGEDAPNSSLKDEYPPILDVSAPYGSLYFAHPATTNSVLSAAVELVPSAQGGLSLLAGQSIYGPGGISVSGAPASVNDLPNPFKPFESGSRTNATDTLDTAGAGELFPFEADTPTGPIHAPGAAPIRVYAGQGDIVSLGIGGVTNVSSTGTLDWYTGSLPTRVIAGQDIVNFGDGLFVNDYPTDVSLLQAGRDIIYANVDVAGPGLLYVQAGRDLYQGAAPGVITSLGQQVVNNTVPPSDSTGGAAITVLAGVGSSGPDYAAFANLYFNDANQANLNLLLTDPANAGKVQQTYGPQLLTWLQQNVGYTGTQAGALAAFLALPIQLQSEFTLPIYFDELRLSGRQFTDPTSRFYKSYARGKQAIATLFPTGDYNGNITLFALPNTSSGTPPTISPGPASAITTNYGGAITILAPGGGVTLGTTTPSLYGFGSPYGVLTFGQGDIDIYSLESVLLGTSRVFTTFGGGITIWSAQGNINAGQGTKSAVVAQPFSLAYNEYGDVTLSPQDPSTGAGIATLNEIPGTTPGDVDLVAPEGTIDAGEAGIRSSGNANLAALVISNAANIQVQGKLTGTPVVAVPNIGALNAAAAVSNAAENSAVQQATKQQPSLSPSIITVEVISFGGS